MYNKLFTKILDSTIWLSPDAHRLVWITLIAAMDEDSIARFASIANLALRARVAEKACAAAILAFESPDPFAPHQEHQGRRIERIPDGWLVLNGQKYREIVSKIVSRERTKERTRKWRERTRDASVTVSDAPLRSVTPSEAISRSEAEASKNAASLRGRFHEIREQYPKRSGDQRWRDAEKHYAARLREGDSHEVILAGVLRYSRHCQVGGKIGTEFVQQAATFLGTNRSYELPWDAPPSKAQVQQDANIDAAREWLHGS